MTLSRRDLVKIGAGASAAVALGVRPGLARGLAPNPRTRPIPSSGEEIPGVGIGTARRYAVGTSAAEREPLKETIAAGTYGRVRSAVFSRHGLRRHVIGCAHVEQADLVRFLLEQIEQSRGRIDRVLRAGMVIDRDQHASNPHRAVVGRYETRYALANEESRARGAARKWLGDRGPQPTGRAGATLRGENQHLRRPSFEIRDDVLHRIAALHRDLGHFDAEAFGHVFAFASRIEQRPALQGLAHGRKLLPACPLRLHLVDVQQAQWRACADRDPQRVLERARAATG